VVERVVGQHVAVVNESQQTATKLKKLEKKNIELWNSISTLKRLRIKTDLPTYGAN
jgi:hypothetical protein